MLTLILESPATVAESDEDKPGVILDYDGAKATWCRCVGGVTDTRTIEFEVPK